MNDEEKYRNNEVPVGSKLGQEGDLLVLARELLHLTGGISDEPEVSDPSDDEAEVNRLTNEVNERRRDNEEPDS